MFWPPRALVEFHDLDSLLPSLVSILSRQDISDIYLISLLCYLCFTTKVSSELTLVYSPNTRLQPLFTNIRFTNRLHQHISNLAWLDNTWFFKSSSYWSVLRIQTSFQLTILRVTLASHIDPTSLPFFVSLVHYTVCSTSTILVSDSPSVHNLNTGSFIG